MNKEEIQNFVDLLFDSNIEKELKKETSMLEIIKEKNNLQQRIDRAIEYIKKNKASLPMGRDEFTCEMRYSDDVVLAHKLLEILGDKENEYI